MNDAPPAASRRGKLGPFNWEDPFFLDDQLTEDERAIKEAAHQFCQEKLQPRVLAAFAVGGLLSLAGALMQLLLRNPLADPYVLGISGGAAMTGLSLLASIRRAAPSASLSSLMTTISASR